MLRRLAVFPGSFTLDAAENVCADAAIPSSSVMPALTALVDRSFVNFERTTGGGRYRLHETMREFALLRLREADEESMCRTGAPLLLCRDVSPCRLRWSWGR